MVVFTRVFPRLQTVSPRFEFAQRQLQSFDQFRIVLRIGCASHIRERYFQIIIVKVAQIPAI